MNLIIPAAGRSSRFNQTRPKWLLTQPNGRMMLLDCISKLELNGVKSIYIVVLKEHLDQYCNGDSSFINQMFSGFTSIPVYVHVLEEQTISQCETIYRLINNFKIIGSIFIKDVDNLFEIDLEKVKGNGLCYVKVEDYPDMKRISEKSFIEINTLSEVINIIEKKVSTNKVCVSGYSFESGDLFKEYYLKMMEIHNLKESELYISHMIHKMMLDGFIFIANQVNGYVDWGTYQDWMIYREKFITLFIDLDGTLLSTSSKYFEPNWSNSEPLIKNITYLQKLKEKNNPYIVITTARDESSKEMTIKLLNKYQIPYDRLIFGLPHSRRYLINDYAPTNPYPSAIAINLARDDDLLGNMM